MREFISSCPAVLLALALGVFALDPAAAAQCELQLLDGHAGNNDSFGGTLAIDDGLVCVGSNGDDEIVVASGAVFVFRRDDGGTAFDHSDDTWPFLAKLKTADAASLDLFGYSVAAAGDWLLAGALWDDDSALNAGSAYVFRRDRSGTPSDPSDDTWTQHVKLLQSGVAAGNAFGTSVAIGEDFALVGCPRASNQSTGQGAVFIYRREDRGTPADPSDDAWVQHGKVTPSPNNLFAGYSVALHGDEALIGTSGGLSPRAWVLRRSDAGTPGDLTDDTWSQVQVLSPPDGTMTQFGFAVALGADMAMVADPEDTTVLGSSGSVDVYRRDNAGTPGLPADDTWVHQQQILASDAQACDWFGISVAMDGDTAVIGSRRACENATNAAYVLRRDDAGTPDPADDSWIEQARLNGSLEQADEGYGEAVALAGDTAVVGSPRAEIHSINDGTAYVVALARAPWSWLGHPLAGTAGEPCLFGYGTLQAGQPVGFTLHRAKPSTPIVFIIGTDELGAPFKGGVLVPQPTLLIFGLATNPAGQLALASVWPGGLPPAFDTTVYQVWMADPAGPSGFAASNGLLGDAP